MRQLYAYPSRQLILNSWGWMIDSDNGGLSPNDTLLGNRGRMFSLALRQQTCCPQSSVPPEMVERQLEQGFAFTGTQRQGYFHVLLSVGDALRKQVSIQFQKFNFIGVNS